MRYDTYRLSPLQWLKTIGIWAGIAFLFAFFFYRSVLVFVLILALFPFFLKLQKKRYIRERKWNLTIQFADSLLGISTALQAGNSVENAFRKTYFEMKNLHGEKSDIVKEFYIILKGLENNITLESLLRDFANRCEVEAIVDFTDIFVVGKRSGGNLRDMITASCNAITERVEMQREFRVLLSSKQFEMRVMSAVPFGILLYIGSTSKGFFDCLYHNPAGIMLMTLLLIVYCFAYLWGMKIIEKTQQ